MEWWSRMEWSDVEGSGVDGEWWREVLAGEKR